MVEHAVRLRNRHVPLLEQHGPTFRAADWGSHQRQAIRFRILTEIGDLSTTSLLDVGCGIGHLVEHLSALDFHGTYLGIDLLPEMIASARACHPRWAFRHGNILHAPRSWTADYVLASGLFTFTDEGLMEKTIRAMFNTCQKGVAFNSLSAWAERKQLGETYADPLATVAFCRTLTPWVILRHDYLPHDFTIYMYREAHRS